MRRLHRSISVPQVTRRSKSLGVTTADSGCKSAERLAVNLFDLDRIPATLKQILFGGKLDISTPIWIDKSRMDETAVAFTCDLLSAACICDSVRNHDRLAKDYPTRVYVQRVEAWSKIPGDAVLTLVDESGACKLSPKVFPSEIVLADAIAPKAKAIQLGGRSLLNG